MCWLGNVQKNRDSEALFLMRLCSLNTTRRSAVTALLLVFTGRVFAFLNQGQGKGHGKHKGGHDDDGGKGAPQGYGYFRSGDEVLLRRYYAGPLNLPPGLRKKYYRTGTLPPGWEKKLIPIPAPIVAQLPPLPSNCERGYIDGQAVVFDRTTRVILDVVDLIAAATGH